MALDISRLAGYIAELEEAEGRIQEGGRRPRRKRKVSEAVGASVCWLSLDVLETNWHRLRLGDANALWESLEALVMEMEYGIRAKAPKAPIGRKAAKRPVERRGRTVRPECVGDHGDDSGTVAEPGELGGADQRPAGGLNNPSDARQLQLPLGWERKRSVDTGVVGTGYDVDPLVVVRDGLGQENLVESDVHGDERNVGPLAAARHVQCSGGGGDGVAPGHYDVGDSTEGAHPGRASPVPGSVRGCERWEHHGELVGDEAPVQEERAALSAASAAQTAVEQEMEGWYLTAWPR